VTKTKRSIAGVAAALALAIPALTVAGTTPSAWGGFGEWPVSATR